MTELVCPRCSGQKRCEDCRGANKPCRRYEREMNRVGNIGVQDNFTELTEKDIKKILRNEGIPVTVLR